MAKTSKTKLTTPSTLSILPVVGTTPETVTFEAVLNEIQLGSDEKFIRVNGKIFTHTAVDQAISDSGSIGFRKFGEVGAATTTCTWAELLKSVKTYGLSPLLKINNNYVITSSFEIV